MSRVHAPRSVRVGFPRAGHDHFREDPVQIAEWPRSGSGFPCCTFQIDTIGLRVICSVCFSNATFVSICVCPPVSADVAVFFFFFFFLQQKEHGQSHTLMNQTRATSVNRGTRGESHSPRHGFWGHPHQPLRQRGGRGWRRQTREQRCTPGLLPSASSKPVPLSSSRLAALSRLSRVPKCGGTSASPPTTCRRPLQPRPQGAHANGDRPTPGMYAPFCAGPGPG